MSRKHRDKIPRNNREYESFLDALAVLKTARNLHLPRSAAAEIEGVPEKTVERYTRSAWRKRGRDFVPKLDDTMPRTIPIPGPGGAEVLEIRDSQGVSLIGKYWNARRKYLRTGDYSELRQFKNRRIPGTKRLFVTNPTKIRAQAKAGLEPKEFYAPWRIVHR